MKNVAIVISPIYTADHKLLLTDSEIKSLKQLNKYLKKHDKYFMVPEGLDISKQLRDRVGEKNIPDNMKYVIFPKKYIGTAQRHNSLLITKLFYEKFKKYKYILLYHLDALVFSDQLEKWCNSGYDYIAAPWFDSRVAFFTHKKGSSKYDGGNGGISLRNVQSFLEIIKIVNNLATRRSNNQKVRMLWFWIAVLTGKSHNIWLKAPVCDYPFNEDGFWSFEAPKYSNNFKVAPFKEALKFSFEKFPRKCFALNDSSLPFGCHAWEKYDKDFWLQYL